MINNSKIVVIGCFIIVIFFNPGQEYIGVFLLTFYYSSAFGNSAIFMSWTEIAPEDGSVDESARAGEINYV